MAINFPANPVHSQTLTAGNVTYIYDSDKSYWKIFSSVDSAAGSLTLTNNLTVGGTMVSSGLTYPTTDGTAGQGIITNGSGTLSFTDLFDGDYASLSGAPTTVSSFTNDAGYITGYTVTQSDVTTHQAALSITESQISDFGTYLTAETDTLDTVTDRGSTTTNGITVGNLTGTYIDLNTTTAPAHSEGRIYYDTGSKAVSYYNDEADVALQIGQELYIRVYNNTGSTISNGAPVYISGQVSGVPTIDLTDASDEVKATCVGLATHTIENATFGYVSIKGLVRGINTSGLTVGGRVHISPSIGGLQTSSPTYPYYTTDVGICLVSDATNGVIFVDIQQQHAETYRTSGDASFGGDVRISGDLTILGTQSVVQVNNIQVDDNIIYLNGGNAIAADDITFSGTGLNDALFIGYYEGADAGTTYYVRIDGVGTGTGGVDTFEWSIDNFSTTEATGVDITGENQLLSNNISVNFNATTGHTSGDTWSGTAAPSNVDIGFMGNRNTGATGPGYTHVGFFYDTVDGKFKAFSEYGLDPVNGNINASDASFVLGDIEAGTFTGNLTGNVTGNVTGNASTATALASGRTISLTGAVTGTSGSFDGTGNVSISTTLSGTFLTDITGENLTDLSDVNITSPTNGQVLKYNGSAWVNGTDNEGTGGGGGITTGKAIAMSIVFG